MRGLVINEPGSFLGVKGDRIVVKKEGKVVAEIAASHLSFVHVATRGATLSSAALRLLLRNRVNVIVLDGYGKPVGRLLPLFRTGLKIVEQQIYALNDARGLTLTKAFATAKVANQANLLRSISYNKRTGSPTLSESLFGLSRKIRGFVDSIVKVEGDLSQARSEIVRLEAEAADLYWEGVASVLVEIGVDFPGRRKRFERPSDPANLLLNYGYSLLASRCIIALEYSGLDPYRGFLHVNSARRPALAMDLMEEFRQPVVDRAVLKVLRERRGDLTEGGGRLSREGRKILIGAVVERLRQRITFKDRTLPLEAHILLQARRLALYLLGKSGEYRGF
ncbi:MAG: CRISPR-associated endonuclease Cas1, partial [Nitrososphaerota archaeon]|nr:CRISPR-associated endonuclease Cas1 [Nitrososphaerota archaeon]